jgi:hypothetical protein
MRAKGGVSGLVKPFVASRSTREATLYAGTRKQRLDQVTGPLSKVDQARLDQAKAQNDADIAELARQTAALRDAENGYFTNLSTANKGLYLQEAARHYDDAERKLERKRKHGDKLAPPSSPNERHTRAADAAALDVRARTEKVYVGKSFAERSAATAKDAAAKYGEPGAAKDRRDARRTALQAAEVTGKHVAKSAAKAAVQGSEGTKVVDKLRSELAEQPDSDARKAATKAVDLAGEAQKALTTQSALAAAKAKAAVAAADSRKPSKAAAAAGAAADAESRLADLSGKAETLLAEAQDAIDALAGETDVAEERPDSSAKREENDESQEEEEKSACETQCANGCPGDCPPWTKCRTCVPADAPSKGKHQGEVVPTWHLLRAEMGGRATEMVAMPEDSSAPQVGAAPGDDTGSAPKRRRRARLPGAVKLLLARARRRLKVAIGTGDAEAISTAALEYLDSLILARVERNYSLIETAIGRSLTQDEAANLLPELAAIAEVQAALDLERESPGGGSSPSLAVRRAWRQETDLIEAELELVLLASAIVSLGSAQAASIATQGFVPTLPTGESIQDVIGKSGIAGAKSQAAWYLRLLTPGQPEVLAAAGELQAARGTGWKPAASEIEQTFRHVATSRGAEIYGTNRLSMTTSTKAIQMIIDAGRGAPGNPVVRVNVEELRRLEVRFLSNPHVQDQLKEVVAHTEKELFDAVSSGVGKTKVAKLHDRWAGAIKAQRDAARFADAHVLDRMPGAALSDARPSLRAERRLQLGAKFARVGGRVLVVYGAWQSTERILQARSGSERDQVILEEAAGWAGAVAGAEVGATLGTPLGPVGMAVTGTIGAIVGAIVGPEAIRAGRDAIARQLDLLPRNLTPEEVELRNVWGTTNSMEIEWKMHQMLMD